jgi:Flp pilus assembly protein TadG
MRSQFQSVRPSQTLRRRQRGAAIVEFALIAMIFLMLLIGIMEFGRWLFTLNAAGEATRLGARLAVVCSNSSADVTKIKGRMRFILGGVTDDQISIQYNPSNSCNADWTAQTNRCESVTVKLTGATFTPLIPFMGVAMALPPFTTTLQREFMNSAANPVCP